MALIIPQKLIVMVERYLSNGDRSREMGGYFFGRNNILNGFLPIPNYAQYTDREYNKGNTKPIADCYARMLDAEIMADMHTHPNGTVPSEGDQRYCQGLNWEYHILVSDKGSEWEWFVLNKQLQSIQYSRSNVELDAYAESIAKEMSMTYLGQVFLSPTGELIGKPEARQVLTVDTDVIRIKDWAKKINSWYITMTKASKDLKIPLSRVKRAFTILGLRK